MNALSPHVDEAGRAPAALRLLNDFQRDFPLVSRPYADIGARLGLDEDAVLAAYRDGLASGVISRIGVVIAPRRVGASTLAAMAVPEERLEQVAAIVSAQAGVSHNYEREDALNLWFVLAAPDADALAATLAGIGRDSGLPVLALPMLAEYHIDLGFDLLGAPNATVASARVPEAPCALPAIEQRLLAALQAGLPLSSRPFAEIGASAGLNEGMTLQILNGWLRDGLLKRFGVVVRHRQLGYTANAMCVWDVPDSEADAIGRQLATAPGVTLCYRRQRALPDWPYNLYCMIHGKQRAEVLEQHAAATRAAGLARFPGRVLFSRRCFKQCGSRFTADRPQGESAI